MALTERELEVQNFLPRDESEARDAARDVHFKSVVPQATSGKCFFVMSAAW